MGYRNETEQLRAKVERLEAQVGAIRGQVEGGRASLFGARVRRQSWLIGILGVLGSSLSLLCLLPAGSEYVELERVSVEEVLVRPAGALPAEVAIQVTIDPAAPREMAYGMYAPSSEDPRLIVVCIQEQCPVGLASFMAYQPERPPPAREFSVTGTVESTLPGHDYQGLSAERLQAYATAIGEPVDSLRVLSPSRRRDPSAPFWIALVLTLLVTLGGSTAFMLHRHGTRQKVEMPTAEDFLPRSPGVAALLYLFTGVYQFYWVYRTTAVLRRLTGRPDLVPGMDLVLSICTLGMWSFWAYYRNAEAIDELYADRDEPGGVRSSVVGYTLASFVCGLAYVGLVHELQSQYNRLAAFQGDAMREALDEQDALA